MGKIKPLPIPEVPRYVTGLRKDGKRDKRYTGSTIANLKKWMNEIAGIEEAIEGE